MRCNPDFGPLAFVALGIIIVLLRRRIATWSESDANSIWTPWGRWRRRPLVPWSAVLIGLLFVVIGGVIFAASFFPDAGGSAPRCLNGIRATR